MHIIHQLKEDSHVDITRRHTEFGHRHLSRGSAIAMHESRTNRRAERGTKSVDSFLSGCHRFLHQPEKLAARDIRLPQSHFIPVRPRKAADIFLTYKIFPHILSAQQWILLMLSALRDCFNQQFRIATFMISAPLSKLNIHERGSVHPSPVFLTVSVMPVFFEA